MKWIGLSRRGGKALPGQRGSFDIEDVMASERDRRPLDPARPGRSGILFGAGLAISAIALAGLGWLVVLGPPAVNIAITHEPDDRWTVTNVVPGGAAWNIGVNPGMEVIGISPGDALPTGEWASLLVTDGSVRIAIQRLDLPVPLEPLIAGVLTLFLAILAYGAVPSVAWWLTLAPPILAAFHGMLRIDPPLNLGLALGGPIVGALYVMASMPRSRRLTWAAFGVLAAALVAWAWAFVAPLEDWRVIRDGSVIVTLGLGAMVLSATLRTAVLRARAGAIGPASDPVAAMARGLADELIPGRSRTRLSAIERERARLANELHADVLPDLSAVIRSIEGGGSPEASAERLRSIAAELRDLMSQRRLGVLEELGLVPALEWLVERVQLRTGIQVELDIDGDAVDERDERPPREVELSAYRVCQQALDNAVLHGQPHSIRVRVHVGSGHVELDVSDDGRSIRAEDEDRALRSGHLGLADMRQTAAAIGGAFGVAAQPEGGTLVRLRWPA
jgi:signal transduction histidine kinase